MRLDLIVDSRLFSAEKYDSALPKAQSQPRATGTVGPGIEMCPTPHEVSLSNSLAIMQPSTVQLWWHDRVSYKDEDGKPQPIVDVCMVWDRDHKVFNQCPRP